MSGTMKGTFECPQMECNHLKMLSRMTPNMSLTFFCTFILKENQRNVRPMG